MVKVTNIVELEVGRHFETDTDRGVIFKKVSQEHCIDMVGLKYPKGFVSNDKYKGLEIKEIYVEYVEKEVNARTYFDRMEDGAFFKFYQKGALYKKLQKDLFLNVKSGKTFKKNKDEIDFEYVNDVEVEVKKMKPGEVPVKFKEIDVGDVFSFHDNVFVRVEGKVILSPYSNFGMSADFNSETEVIKYEKTELQNYNIEDINLLELKPGDIFTLKQSSGKIIKGQNRFYFFETGEVIDVKGIEPVNVDLLKDPDIVAYK
jgi:hypothetical protein